MILFYLLHMNKKRRELGCVFIFSRIKKDEGPRYFRSERDRKFVYYETIKGELNRRRIRVSV